MRKNSSSHLDLQDGFDASLVVGDDEDLLLTDGETPAGGGSAVTGRLTRHVSGLTSYVTTLAGPSPINKLHKRRSSHVMGPNFAGGGVSSSANANDDDDDDASNNNNMMNGRNLPAGADFFTLHQLYRKPTKQEEEELTTRPYTANYMYQYPESLYGPYCERLPEPPAQKVGGTLQSSVGSLRNLSPKASKSVLSGHGGDNQLPSVADHSFLVSTARPFGREWQELSMLQCKNLSQIGTRLRLMRQLAIDFGNHVAPHAARIVEERVLSNGAKSIKPLPGFDHVFVHQGNVYTIACTPSRIKLYGSRDAAHRAASNEMKAARALLGAQYIDLVVPLSSMITHMGADVYVTAPVGLGSPGKDNLVYGSLSGRSAHTEPCATYEAFQMAEYLPLAKHTFTPSGGAQQQGGADGNNNNNTGGEKSAPLASGQATVNLYTAADVKQFYSIDEGCTFAMDLARWMPPAVCTPEYSKTRTRDSDSVVNRSVKSRHKLEDSLHGNLSVLFRPEFMRLHCPVQLNGDAGTPSQPAGSQEKIGHATDHLYGVVIPQLCAELIATQKQRPVQGSELSNIFHQNGVNMRYLGRVLHDLELEQQEKAEANATNSDVRQTTKNKDEKANHEAREKLINLLTLEVTARTWKSVLYDKFALEDLANMEESLTKDVLSHLRGLLKVDAHETGGGQYWDDFITPRMKEKFDCAYCPIVTDIRDDETTRRRMQPADPNSLQLYRAIKNTKVRIEKIEPTEQWEVSGDVPGHVKLAGRGGGKKNDDGNGTVSDVDPAATSLLPLLGETARANSALIARAFSLIGVEVSSDVRGKRIAVVFKPKIKPCVPLLMSPTVAACVEKSPLTLFDALAVTRDSTDLCQAVEEAARAEITSMKKHSDTDPRAMLPLYLLARAHLGKSNMSEAFSWMSRCLELRTASLPDIVLGKGSFVAAQIFAQMGRYDRAEALLYDGFHNFKSAGLDTCNILMAQMVYQTARLMSGTFWSEGRVPPADKLSLVLDYFSLAAGMMERLKDRRLPYVLEAIAALRKRLAGVVHCYRCRGPAEIVLHNYDREPGGDKPIGSSALPSERDTLSQAHTTGTRGTLPPAARRAAGGGPARRRKGDEDKKGKQEEDLNELFVKSTLNSVDTLLSGAVATMYGEVVGGGSSSGKKSTTNKSNEGSGDFSGEGESAPSPTAALRKGSVGQLIPVGGSGASTANTANKSVAGADGQYLGGQLLEGLSTPHKLTRAGRYMCLSCHKTVAALHKDAVEPVMMEVVKLYNRALKLLQVAGPITRPAGDGALSSCLVSLGVLQKDPSLVHAAIQDLIQIYGEGSKPVINTQLQLAEVLRKRAETVDKYTGKTHDLDFLIQSEDTLRQTLSTLLKKGKDQLLGSFSTELGQVVRLLQEITELYSTLPAAKREHQARHYLIELLPQHIGQYHPLVSMALGRTSKYYLKVANIQEDGSNATPAALTALKTGANYALQLLECHVNDTTAIDASSDIDYTIEEIREKVIKVLRVVGGAAERNLATDYAAKVKSAINIPPATYSQHPTVVAAIKAMDDVFRRQLKIIEQSEKSALVVSDLNMNAKELRAIARKIMSHGDRTDFYCQMLVRRAREIRALGVQLQRERDLTVADKARELVDLHDDLLREDGTELELEDDSPSSSNAHGDGLDSFASGGGSSKKTRRRGGAGKYPEKEELLELAKPQIDDFSEQALDQAIANATSSIGGGGRDGGYDGGGRHDGRHGGKGPYVSPYAALGMPSNNSVDDPGLSHQQSVSQRRATQHHHQSRSGFGVGGSQNHNSRSRRSTTAGGGGHNQLLLSTTGLSAGNGIPKWMSAPSPTHHVHTEDATFKKEETTKQLNKLFPRLNASAGKKDYSKLKNIL